MSNWWAVLAIGAGVGFLAGLFGKGGSALATPLLHAAGVPALVAVATPLPAAIPSTLVASVPYWRQHFVDRQVLRWTMGFGIPATLVGALASRWVSGDDLVLLTDVLLIGIGVRTLARPHAVAPAPIAGVTAAPAGAAGLVTEPAAMSPTRCSTDRRMRLAAAGLVVGLASGLLANSGGFLLVPLYLTVLRLPIKSAFASSLVVSAAAGRPWHRGARGTRPCRLAGARGVRCRLGAVGQPRRPGGPGHRRCAPGAAVRGRPRRLRGGAARPQRLLR